MNVEEAREILDLPSTITHVEIGSVTAKNGSRILGFHFCDRYGRLSDGRRDKQRYGHNTTPDLRRFAQRLGIPEWRVQERAILQLWIIAQAPGLGEYFLVRPMRDGDVPDYIVQETSKPK